MELRSKILITLYKLFPFTLKGDLRFDDITPIYEISCVINFYGRINLLEGILYSLTEQDLSIKRFEVILVEDRGGTREGREVAERFKDVLNVRYFAISENFGTMGYSRNLGLSKTQGEYVLFLDDDTVILQKKFLSNLISIFRSSGADAVVPHGTASYGILKGTYDFHDPYYPTNRCMAYRRDVMRDLRGFVADIIGQEDVEFVVRFLTSGRKFFRSEKLKYFHPPLIVNSLGKPAAVGVSFARLRKRYPLLLWLMLLINGSRFLPLLIFPFNNKWRMQGRFSLGFALGVLYSVTGRSLKYN
jgi:glycosyltransferase involved in cell wall biosynthesis